MESCAHQLFFQSVDSKKVDRNTIRVGQENDITGVANPFVQPLDAEPRNSKKPLHRSLKTP
jgi:hypothetical protein